MIAHLAAVVMLTLTQTSRADQPVNRQRAGSACPVLVAAGAAFPFDGAYRGRIVFRGIHPDSAPPSLVRRLIEANCRVDRAVAGLQHRAVRDTLQYPAHRPILRLVRASPPSRTPSAVSRAGEIVINVDGSLLGDLERAVALLAHERFHLVDRHVAGVTWSARRLADSVNATLAECQGRLDCLKRYAPTSLMVRGGTYYAFQPGNNVAMEFAAELAARIILDAIGNPATRSADPHFKCRSPRNAFVWRAMVDDYFAGVDPSPRCRV